MLCLEPPVCAGASEATYDDVSRSRAQATAYTEEGLGGTRVVTPYYAVFLEDRMFSSGYAFEYVEDDGVAFGVLNVYAPTAQPAGGQGASYAATDGLAGQPAYRLYCVPASSGVEVFEGSYASASLWSETGGYTVAVAVPYGTGFSSGAEAQGFAAISTLDEAQRLATALRNRTGEGPTSRLLQNGDDTVSVETPWYTVCIPNSLFPDGWYYTYSDAVHDWSGDASGAYFGRQLNVYAVGCEAPVFSVACAKGFGVQGEVVSAELASFGGDWEGWTVLAFKTTDYDSGADEQDGRLLAQYAALVSVTQNPGVNPPAL